MRARRILDVVFGLLVVSAASYVLFSDSDNNLDCDNSVPADSAQSAALADARSRKAAACSHARCQFVLVKDPDGSLQVSLYFVKTNLIGGCISTDQDSEIFVYDREGKFIRIDGAPYA